MKSDRCKEYMKEKEEEILEKDIEEFLTEKERIRNILGKIGGKVTFINKVMNFFWVAAVMTTFVISIFMQNTPRLIMIEVGVLLISLKVVYYFNRQAKVDHFQFWILSSIEWRINEIVKKLNELTKENRK